MKKYKELEGLLLSLSAKDITLYLDGEKLKFKAPKGAVTDSDRESIKAHKEDLIAFLKEDTKDHVIDPDAPFPLTEIQAAYLMGRHKAFAVGNVPCHIYFELEYPPLDPSRMEEAIYKTIERHSMMRAAFDENGTQRILPMPESYSLITEKATDQKAEEALLQKRWDEMSHPVYDPQKGFLFDFKLTEGTEKSYLHFSIEFIIADWASIWNIVSDVEHFYDHPEEELKPLSISFQEAVSYEKSQKKTMDYLKDEAYWMEQKENVSNPPELPTIGDPLAIKDDKVYFKRYQLKLSKEKWDALKEAGRKRGFTPTGLVMGAYAEVLAKWSRTKHFALNLTVLNRPDLAPDIGEIVGDFTSNILIETDRRGKRTFEEGVRQINHAVFSGVEHKSYSAVSLMREIGKEQDADLLMPYVFTSALGLVNDDKKPVRADLTRHAISQTPQVFIDCQALEDSKGLSVNWDVREGIFPDGLVDDMFDAFRELIRGLTEDDAVWLDTDAVKVPYYQLEIIKQMNDTKELLNTETLHGAILHYGKSAGYKKDKAAVICEDTTLTYEALFYKAGKLCKIIREKGDAEGRRICIFMDKCVDQAVAVLATLALGAAYVPVDPHSGKERITDILSQVDPLMILSDGNNEDSMPKDCAPIIHVGDIPYEAADSLLEQELPEVSLDSMAYIIFTSGTTGKPKGVAISHRQATNTIESINRMWNLNENATAFGISQLNFDLSVYDIFGMLRLGGTLVMPSQENYKNPAKWKELMEAHKVTVWNSVPALMQMLLTYLDYSEEESKVALKLILLSGDWTPQSLPPQIKNAWKDVTLSVMGGATEGSIWSIYHEWKENLPGWSSVPYGRPLANQGYLVLDENLCDCPYWVTGQLAITGEGVAMEYFNDPTLTEAKFPIRDGKRIYLTGDLGRYRPGGEIEFVGRMDRQLKLHGHRVEPGEVEAAIKRRLGVKEVFVGVLKTDPVLATLVVREDPIDFQKLKADLKNDLPDYMIPSCCAQASVMPLTKNGKLDQKEILRLLDAARMENNEKKDETKHSETEAKLLKIWQEELSDPDLGVEEDFFDVGGDSLLIAKMAGRMKKEITDAVSFEEYLTYTLSHPTVRELAELVDERTN